MKLKFYHSIQFNTELKIFLITSIISSIFVMILLHFFRLDLFPDYYGIIAKNILIGNGYTIPDSEIPVLFRPPIYPLFLALLFSIFGSSQLPVICVQVIINSLTAVIIYKLFRNIFNHKISFATALLWASYPLSNYYLIRELPTTIFICLFMLFLNVFNNFHKSFDYKNSFYLGFLLGTLILTKLFIKGFLLLIPLYIITRQAWIGPVKTKTMNCNNHRHNNIKVKKKLFLKHFQINRNLNYEFRPVFLNLVFLLLGLIITLSPWVIRNYYVTDSFPVLGSGGGYTLWFGNNIDFDGLDMDQLAPSKQKMLKKEINQIIVSGLEVDFENDKKLYDEAYKNFLRFPRKTAILMLKKFFRLWFSIYSPSMSKYQWLLILIQATIIIPALIGVILSIKRRLNIFSIICALIYFQFVYTLFTATVRYCLPVMPIIFAFAVYGSFETINYFQQNLKSLKKV